MIIFIGDIHGDNSVIERLVDELDHDTPITIIQIGDFGFAPKLNEERLWDRLPWKTYAIDGNHEYFPMISKLTEVTKMANNLYYVPRGTVLNIDGYDIGFLGGAHSVDKAWRKEGLSWFRDEVITDEQCNKLIGKKVDILVTHNPPDRVIKQNFPPLNLRSWGLPSHWKDVCSVKVENVWRALGEPLLFCGHMHKTLSDGNCRILDINEIFFIPSKNDFGDVPISLDVMDKLNWRHRMKAFQENSSLVEEVKKVKLVHPGEELFD